MKKKEKYLSIGEFSRQTGFSIKALRYYDRIGVLKPAHVDPDTNYRYYSQKQIFFSLFIDIATECEIPLSYCKENLMKDENNIDWEKMIVYCKSTLKQKIEQFQNNYHRMEAIEKSNDRMNSYAVGETKLFEFDDTNIILLPCKHIIDSPKFNKIFGDLAHYMFTRLGKNSIGYECGIYIDGQGRSFMFNQYFSKKKPALDSKLSYLTLKKYKAICHKTRDIEMMQPLLPKNSIVVEVVDFTPDAPEYEIREIQTN